MARRKYLTEEERKEANRIKNRKWKKKNKDKIAKYNKQYCRDHTEEKAEYNKLFNKTQMGRACSLVKAYKRNDKLHNRGECTLTSKWIVENIFTKSCIYCGETNWKELGCDRIDNDLPHTKDNVVCCCTRCNRKRHKKTFEEFKNEMQKQMLEETEAPF